MTVNVCTCEIQLCCELTVVNRLHQLCSSVLFTHCLPRVCNLLFNVLPYWSCDIMALFSVHLSGICLITAVQLFTLPVQSLPTITCSLPEVLITNKRTTKILPCPDPVQSSSILSSESIVPHSGTSKNQCILPTQFTVESRLDQPD